MAKSNLRLLAVFLLASILIFSTFIPVCSAEEFEDSNDETLSESSTSTEDDITSEVVQSSEDKPEVEEEILIRTSPGVEVSCVFPKHDSKRPVISAGDPTDVVVGILNGGETDLRVSSLEVKLVFPLDYKMVIQNFTVQNFDSVVSSGAQASFPITFTPDKNFQPRDFGLTGFITYEIDSENFGSVFFNSTIEIIEPIGYVSGESVFLVLLGLALFGLFLMWLSSQFKTLKKKTKVKKSEPGVEGDSEGVENEWLQGTFFTLKPSNPTLRSKSKRKKAT